MAEPRTQDLHKVFNSATTRLQSFMDGVQNASGSKNMEIIYKNIGRMVDAFTRGKLAEQGANSQELFRQVYRSLDDNFLEIIQSQSAVDKIIELINEHGNGRGDKSSDKEKSSSSSADIGAEDPVKLVVDFLAELQDDILTIYRNLSRQYNRQKFKYEKWQKTQEQELKSISDSIGSYDEQERTVQEQIEQMSKDEEQYVEDINRTKRLLDTFSKVEDTNQDLYSGLGKLTNVVSSIETKMKSSFSLLSKKEKKQNIDLIKEDTQKKLNFKEQKNPEADKSGDKQTQDGNGESKSGKQDKKKKGINQDSKLNPTKVANPKGTENNAAGLLKKGDKNTKLNVKPSADDMCVCPICGGRHKKGVHSQENLTKEGVETTIGQIHKNITTLINSESFKKRFMLGYKKINKGIQKQMKKIDKDESSISKDLDKTKKMVEESRKPKPQGSMLRLLLQPAGLVNIAVIALGGLILITLTRMALKKFKDTYMPPTNGQKLSLFGIEIPGLAEIKSFALGIWNFVVVGIPNIVGRVTVWVSKITKKLFGKKGIFSSFGETRRTLKKIALAFLIGKSKGPVGGFLKGIGKLIFEVVKNFVKIIPGWGIAISILLEFIPAIYTYITTQLMLMWTREKEDQTEKFKDLAKRYSNRQVKSKIKRASSRVKPFIRTDQMSGLGLEVPSLQNKTSRFNSKGAIMRNVTPTTAGTSSRSNAEYQLNKNKLEQKYDSEEEKVKNSGNIRWKPGDTNNYNIQLVHTASLDFRSEGPPTGMISLTKKFLEPQINKLHKYQKRLQDKIQKRHARFKAAYRRPLYDLNTGWNPAYAVRPSELVSPLPADFFDTIHDVDNISIGSPAGFPGENDEWIGQMPFTWLPSGFKNSVSADPLRYEMQRTNNILQLYKDLQSTLEGHNLEGKSKSDVNYGFFGWKFDSAKEDFYEETQDKIRDLVANTRKAYEFLANPEAFNGTKKVPFKFAESLREDSAGNTIYYGDTFSEYLGRLRKQEDFSNNMLDATSSTEFYNIDKEVEGGYKTKEEREGYSWLVPLEHVTTSTNTGFYDTNYEEHRAGHANAMLRKLKTIKTRSMSYSSIRDMMLRDFGIRDVFLSPDIFDPRGNANKIARKYIQAKRFILRDFGKSGGSAYPELFSLIQDYFSEYAKIRDSSTATNRWWDRIGTDKNAQAGFGQSILEYFGYVVIPQWNKVEALVRQYISSGVEDEDKIVTNEIQKLIALCSKWELYSHLSKHLKFGNIKTNIITDENATEEQKKQIDKYRKSLGIPTHAEKISILNKLGNSLPTDLDGWKNRFRYIQGLMGKAKMEAEAINDFRFLDALSTLLNNAAQNISGFENDSSHIVVSPGDIPKMVAMPTRTQQELDQIAEEERKRDEERKRKEKEERKKKLEEQAERRKKLVEAQIKIEAMEKLRKQERTYEELLDRLVHDTEHVTEKDLKAVGNEIEDLKQEAENRINELPRDKRDIKLALLRGDKVSAKTFKELKDTAIGLHGSLQSYIEEVNKIPCGSIMSVQNTASSNTKPVRMADSDSVDMGDD